MVMGLSFEKLKHPSQSPLFLFRPAAGPKEKVPYPNSPLGLKFGLGMVLTQPPCSLMVSSAAESR